MNNSQEKSRISILLTSARMAVATLLSRILGLFREQLIAAYFGASGLTDAFYVAYRIPNLLRDLFAEGAFSSAFVPVFTEAKKESQKHMQRLFVRSFWILLLITLTLSALIFLNAASLVKVFAPSFANSSEKLELTVLMVRIMSPFLLFISLAALCMSTLNTFKVFFLPAFMPAIGNIAVIVSIIFLTPYLSGKGLPQILSAPIGVIIGGVFQFLLQVPSLLKLGFNFFPPKIQFTSKVKKIYKKMGPGLLGFSINQINLIINTRLATGVMLGAASWLNFGFRLFQFPNGIISVSLGNSNLVHFSNYWKKGEKEKAKNSYLSAYEIMLFFILPITFFTLQYCQWLTHLIFERGNFTRIDTINSSQALFYYALSLPFYGLYKISVPTFYVLDKEKIPVYASIVGIIVNVSIALMFTNTFGFKTLAASASAGILVNCSILLYFLKQNIHFQLKQILSLYSLKILMASILCLISSYYFKKLFRFYEFNFMLKLLYLSLNLITFFFIYILFIYFFGEGKRINPILKKFRFK